MRANEKYGLTTDEWQGLADGIARAEYHLLLGAGFNHGAEGGDGKPIPFAADLARDLVKDFGVGASDDPPLPDAYELASKHLDPDGRSLDAYFRHRFSNCRPTWQSVVARLRWHRIWTLNVDDCVEQAYTLSAQDASQPLTTVQWSDLYREPDRGRDEAQVIHLHGFLDGPKVFSILEYLRATSEKHAWHAVLADQYAQRPFLIVGATLTQEYDLAEFLRRGTSKSKDGRRSIVVLRTIDEFRREQLTGWGVLPVAADAQEFFRDLEPAVRQAEEAISALIPASPHELTREARTFLQQFEWLRLDATLVEDPDHDFYRGDEPAWADILRDRQARFDVTQRLISDIGPVRGPLPEVRQRIVLVTGTAGNGKTTTLLAAGRALIASSYDVFRFRAEERMDSTAVRWWFEHMPQTALLVDGAADFAGELQGLAEECADRSIEFLAICAERSTRQRQIITSIAPKFLRTGYGVDVLSDPDIERLVDKLNSARRLGRLFRATRRHQIDHFKAEANRQLVVGMESLTPGAGFASRVLGEVRGIPVESTRILYLMSCMSYTLGYALPVGIAEAASGTSSQELSEALESYALGLLRVDRRGLRPRHRLIANIVVLRGFSQTRRLNAMASLGKALSPFITLATIRERTTPFLIARELMDSDVVLSWLGRESAPRLYDMLVEHFDWNARFWEQRALTESALDNYEKARSFAEVAVARNRGAFTYNTLATVICRYATYRAERGASATAVLAEALGLLEESKRLGNSRFEHPFNTYFKHTLRYYRAQPDEITDEVRLSWRHWMADAKNSFAFAAPELQEELNSLNWQWARLSAVKPEP